VLTSLDGLHFGTDTIFRNLLSGSYRLYIDQGGCLDTISFEVYPAAAPEVFLPADTVLLPGQAILLQSQVPLGSAYLFTWTPDRYLSCADCPAPIATPATNTVYTLVVTDDTGCTNSATTSISIRQAAIYAPNVFRPGSGNDFFTLYADESLLEKIGFLHVFDRWGEAVFERSDFSANVAELGWDGLFRGKPLAVGIYTWHARIVFRNGDTEDRTGDVLLVR
jgi:hypothetical protein